jgi:hypothetical protein
MEADIRVAGKVAHNKRLQATRSKQRAPETRRWAL